MIDRPKQTFNMFYFICHYANHFCAVVMETFANVSTDPGNNRKFFL